MARKPKQTPSPEAELLERIENIDIAGVMQERYQEYAAAVVVGRAIADVRDGLKPVHRRILYTMMVGKYDWTAGFRKSARIVGDCMGKFHPHGDSSIYEAMARLTQSWSVTAPLIDGQGNFGSPDGDNPAAMRYTEARLAKISRFLLDEINRDTVDFRPNYDELEVEPVVLPAAFPNVLVNGGSGIAVGMASSVPPHNLGEVIDATLLRLHNPDISLEALMTALPGPDFPTGGRVIGNAGIVRAYETGRGTLDIEASTHFEKEGRTTTIVYTDMPWGIARPSVLARINELMNEGKLPDAVSARDETDRTGPRFVVELRPDADAEHVDRILKSQTGLRTGVSLNFTLLDGRGIPREMGLADILDEWIRFRRTTVRRRATFDLAKARDRGRLLLGRIAALSIIDKLVKMIRASKNREEAIDAITGLTFVSADFQMLINALGTKEQKKGKRFQLDRLQAEDILAMRLQRLTGLDREEIESEARRITALMQELREILSSPSRLDEVIAAELEQVRSTGTHDRKTIIDAEATVVSARLHAPITPKETTFILETTDGLLGRSKKGAPDEGHFRVTEADTHARVVVFTTKGMSYGIDVPSLPALEAKEQPRPIPGLLGLTPLGDVASLVLLSADDVKPVDDGGSTLTFVSADGMIRRTPASEFARIPQPGKMAMKLEIGDPDLLWVFKETSGTDEAGNPKGGAVLLATRDGKVIRFALGDMRVMAGRSSRGVRGMKLESGDHLVSAFEVPDIALSAELSDEIEKGWLGKTAKRDLSSEAASMLDGYEVVQMAKTGHMKRTPLHAYRQSRRDGRGFADKGPAKTIGDIVGMYLIAPGQSEIRVRADGQVVTLATDGIRKGAKATTGQITCEGPIGFF